MISQNLRAIIPVNPPPPPSYPCAIDDLRTVPVFAGKNGRAQFQQYNDGFQAPPFIVRDKNGALVKIKKWYITTDVPVTVTHFDGVKNVFYQKTYTPEEAAFINIPGAYVWPSYRPAPSGAFQILEGQRRQLPNDGLSAWADAGSLAQELKAAGWQVENVEEFKSEGVFAVQYDVSEVRRMWNINIRLADGSFQPQNAGLLFKMKYANGVGAPGEWLGPNKASTPSWAAYGFESGEFSVAPEVPIPVRPLLDNETLKVTPFGVQVIKYEANQVEAGGGDAKSLDALGIRINGLSVMLANLVTKLDRLLGAFGIGGN